ncbi:MAG TPA: hypothetical protein VGB98_19400 [Pyrinomonadaceae bacterium]|jgi:hypothetical protein
MSRHAITPREPEKYLCWVGYDRGADSYFIYVSRHMKTDERQKIIGENDGHCVYHAGTTPGEIDSVETLATMLAPYADLPAKMFQTLRDDRLRESASSVKAVAPANKEVEARGRNYVRQGES